MIRSRAILFSLALAAFSGGARAGEPALMATPGEPLLRDDFDREALGEEWELNDARRTVSGQTKIAGGKLVMAQSPKADHGAVAGRAVAYSDAVIRLRFQMTGKRGFHLNLGDDKCKEVHAGHIARVAVGPGTVEVRDDKTGVMNLELRKLRAEPGQEAAVKRMLDGKSSLGRRAVSLNEWHELTAEIVGDELLVSIDGAPAAYLKSPGIGHPTKSRVALSAAQDEVWFDDLEIRAATARPEWPARRAEVVGQLSPAAPK